MYRRQQGRFRDRSRSPFRNNNRNRGGFYQRRRFSPAQARNNNRGKSRSPIPLKDRFLRLERFQQNVVSSIDYTQMMQEAKEISIVIERSRLNMNQTSKGPIIMKFDPDHDYLDLSVTETKQRRHAIFDCHEILKFRHDKNHGEVLTLPEERVPPSSSFSHTNQQEHNSHHHRHRHSSNSRSDNRSSSSNEPHFQRQVVILSDYERRLKKYILDRKKNPHLPEFSSRPDKWKSAKIIRNPVEVPRNRTYYQHDDRFNMNSNNNRSRSGFQQRNYQQQNQFGDDNWQHDRFQQSTATEENSHT